MELRGRAFFPSASDDEVGGYKRAMREQQAQKSCNEIENKNRPSDLGIVILAWQTYPLRAVPPAPRASQTRLTTRKAVPSPNVRICIDCLKGRS